MAVTSASKLEPSQRFLSLILCNPKLKLMALVSSTLRHWFLQLLKVLLSDSVQMDSTSNASRKAWLKSVLQWKLQQMYTCLIFSRLICPTLSE
jgi:hypothetical protein